MVNTSETKNEKLKNNEATVQVMKKPKTFAQQVEIIKEKGFIIDNDTECIGFLKHSFVTIAFPPFLIISSSSSSDLIIRTLFSILFSAKTNILQVFL